jgi:prophage regulatory protein
MPTKLPEKFKTSLRLTEPTGSNGHVAKDLDDPPVRPGRSPAPDPPPARLLRFPAVRERTGLSRSTIWRMERQGQFPQHHQISRNAVAWSDEEIDNWIKSKLNG